MSDPVATEITITKLLPGSPVTCPKCGGWGKSLELHSNHPCTHCMGQRTMRLAEVSGIIYVPVEAKQGDKAWT